MTMTEKILARVSEKSNLEPGENVWVNVNVLMTHDVCGPGTIGIFKKEFRQNALVWDREKIVIIPYHYIFTSDECANRNVDILRDFCLEQNIKYFYDIKDLSNFKVWMDIYSLPVPGSGGKTCSQIFEEAVCDTPTSPSCGACLSGPRDTYARMNEPQICVSATNKSFPGGMGHKEGQIYLASAYTAAASALTGYVADPRDFLL